MRHTKEPDTDFSSHRELHTTVEDNCKDEVPLG